jgi:hypothetical protein
VGSSLLEECYASPGEEGKRREEFRLSSTTESYYFATKNSTAAGIEEKRSVEFEFTTTQRKFTAVSVLYFLFLKNDCSSSSPLSIDFELLFPFFSPSDRFESHRTRMSAVPCHAGCQPIGLDRCPLTFRCDLTWENCSSHLGVK